MPKYDRTIIAFSGGKDSLACVLYALEKELPNIELWHHLVDGREGSTLMDWPVTEDYCKKVAEALKLPLYFSWLEGGFEREMLRNQQKKAKTFFETPEGLRSAGGTRGKNATRLKFPQISPDLSVRWCSAYLKIDVATIAINNQPRFKNSKTLLVTGERAEESAARAEYSTFEPDRSDNRNGRTGRWVDRYRPVHSWSEKQVWEIIERHKINPHPAYKLGWGRLSCMSCFTADTEVITREGIKKIGDLTNNKHSLLIPKSTPFGLSSHGKFRDVEVLSFGFQGIIDLTIAKGRYKKTISTTVNHRWLVSVKNKKWTKTVERTTAELMPGDELRSLSAQPLNTKSIEVPFAVARGFFYGDGTAGGGERPGVAYFFGEDKKVMLPYFAQHKAVYRDRKPNKHDANPKSFIEVNGIPSLWKESPDFRESRSYLLSWLAGYFAADGTVSSNGQAKIYSASLESISLARSVAAICGVGYGKIVATTRKGRGKETTALYSLDLDPFTLPDWFFVKLTHKTRIQKRMNERPKERRNKWKVVSRQETKIKREVFCAVVPGVRAFGLVDGIMTGNCIFGSENQWASIQKIAPEKFEKLSTYEKGFDMSLRKGTTIPVWAEKGSPYPALTDSRMVDLAMSTLYTDPIRVDPWTLPPGAFGENAGPT